MTKFTGGLRARRERVGLSREKLAQRVGCSSSTIQQVEGGWRCSPLMQARIAEAVGCERHELYERVEVEA